MAARESFRSYNVIKNVAHIILLFKIHVLYWKRAESSGRRNGDRIFENRVVEEQQIIGLEAL